MLLRNPDARADARSGAVPNPGCCRRSLQNPGLDLRTGLVEDSSPGGGSALGFVGAPSSDCRVWLSSRGWHPAPPTCGLGETRSGTVGSDMVGRPPTDRLAAARRGPGGPEPATARGWARDRSRAGRAQRWLRRVNEAIHRAAPHAGAPRRFLWPPLLPYGPAWRTPGVVGSIAWLIDPRRGRTSRATCGRGCLRPRPPIGATPLRERA